MALQGCLLEPFQRLIQVALDALAAVKKLTQLKLRLQVAFAGGALAGFNGGGQFFGSGIQGATAKRGDQQRIAAR
jgi:hypothetical protein